MRQFDDFGFFFQPNLPRQREFKTNALGSGVIVDSKKGYILTNNHVVDDMDGIRVKLIDKREFEATIIGTDPKTDLAILQIDAENLDDIRIGDSDELRVGEWVMAVGSPFSENLKFLARQHRRPVRLRPRRVVLDRRRGEEPERLVRHAH